MRLSTHIHKLSSVPSLVRWLRAHEREFRVQSVLNVLIGIADVAVGLAVVWVSKLVVDLATHAPSAADSRLTLPVACAILVALILSEVAMSYASRWIRAILGVRAKNRLQEQLFYKLLISDWESIRQHHSGDLINRLQRDVDTISVFLAEQFPSLLATLIQFVGAFCFLYWMNPYLALLIVLFTPIFLLLARLFMRKMRGYKHEERDQEAAVNMLLQESLQHALVLKAFSREEYATDKLTSEHNHYRSIIARNTRYSAGASLVVNVCFAAGYLLAFFWGIYELNLGLITFGSMLAFVQLVGQIQGPIRRLTGYVSVFVSTFTSADRLRHLEDLPFSTRSITSTPSPTTPYSTPSSPTSPSPYSPPSPSAEERGQVGPRNSCLSCLFSSPNLPSPLQLKNLTFAYSDAPDQYIFKDWSAEIPCGKLTVVVGHTGIGKTTLISLLLGLFKPQSGSISPLPQQGEGLGLGALSFVPQGNTLMSGTIRSNLLIGNPAATDAEMLEALRIAEADFVLLSPEGLDLSCGERGAGLSEGQAQRVAIARALLSKAPVLILDEAFSALDSATADSILSRLRRLTVPVAPSPSPSAPVAPSAKPVELPLTLILITHRDALIPQADHVIRLSD